MVLKYKSYWRKSGLKGKWGDIYLSQLNKHKPKNFLEVGVFCGVTARNTCNYLKSIHGDNFKYIGIDLFDSSKLNKKDEFEPDFLKVASRDLTNLPLLEVLSETKIPMIISTGMAGKKELDIALEIILKSHGNISILHCVSEYPTRPENVNLNSISYLLKNYGTFTIGYSDHTIGISAAVAAVAMGANIIEKHITLDRKMKGSNLFVFENTKNLKIVNKLRINSIFGNIKRRSHIKKVPFDLTLEYLIEIFPKDMICPVSGERMNWGGRKSINTSPSVDRIIPEKGYVTSNVRWISFHCNLLKSNRNLEMIEKIYFDMLHLKKNDQPRNLGKFLTVE